MPARKARAKRPSTSPYARDRTNEEPPLSPSGPALTAQSLPDTLPQPVPTPQAPSQSMAPQVISQPITPAQPTQSQSLQSQFLPANAVSIPQHITAAQLTSASQPENITVGQVPVSGSSRRTRTNQSSSELPEQPIVGEISRLIQNSVSKNTQSLYASGIDAFDSFRRSQNLPVIWPPPTNHIVQFIAAMSLKGYAESTVRSYIKGVSFKCKIYHQCDPTRYFVISKMLEGMKRLTKTPDTRLPITISMLSLMLPKLDIICTNLYEAKLFRAAFSISFFAFLRIGELALSKGNSAESVIGIRDIKLSNSELSLLIRKSKTDQYGKGIHILLHRTGDSNCPVEKMAQFLRIRPVIDGPLFCHFDRSPITRYQFSSVLSKTIRSLGLNSLNFKTHSFRIGAATTAAEMGLSDSDIQVAGRWRSQAFKAYIRSPLTPI